MKRAEVLDRAWNIAQRVGEKLNIASYLAWFNGDARLAASHFMRDFLAIRGAKDEWSPHYTIT